MHSLDLSSSVTARFWKQSRASYVIEKNTTVTFIGNETALGQQNSTFIIVESNAARIIIIKLCARCSILQGSFFGNTFIIIIVYKHQLDLPKTINYFIVNMAVSDLLFSLILLPVQVTQLVTMSLHWHVGGILGSSFCKLFYFASSVSLLVSNQSVVRIATDRLSP